MSLIVETHVVHPDLLLNHAIRTAPEATVRIEAYPITDPDCPLVFLRVETDDPGAFEAALDADPTVADPLFVTAVDGYRIYRVRVTDEPHLLSPKLAALAGRVVEARSGDGGWYTRVEVPDREPIREFRRYCEEHGIEFTVSRLYRAEGRDGPLDRLTDDQRETLLAAHAAGYFDVPRRTTQGELAADFGVTDSAISQRIRRAMGSLVESVSVPDESR